MPGELIRREALERIIPRAAELRGLTESAASQKTDRAPMLVGTPFPVKLSVLVALGPALWIR